MFFQSSKIKKLQMEMLKEKKALHYPERIVITWFHQQTENFRMPEVTQEKQIPDSDKLPEPSVLKLMKFCQPQYV